MYQLLDLPPNRRTYKRYIEQVIKKKVPLLHEILGHQSFVMFSRNMNSYESYEAFKIVLEDPEFFFVNHYIFKFMADKC